jgi:hypothetical protein
MTPGTQVRLTAMLFVGRLLGDGNLRPGDITLGLQNGLFMGSDVGIFVH